MSLTIETNFDGLKRMAREFHDALPSLDRAGLDGGFKAFGLAYIGCKFPETTVGRADRDAGAPALYRIVMREYIERQIELDRNQAVEALKDSK